MANPSTEIFQFVIRDPPAREATGSFDPVPAEESGERGGSAEDSGGARSAGSSARMRVATRERPLHLASRGGARRPLPPAAWDRRTTHPMHGLRDGPLVAAGMLIGVGLAGFLGGVLVREVAPLRGPGGWEGPLQGVSWLALVVGLAGLWRVARSNDVSRRTATFIGSIALGGGFVAGIQGALREVHAALDGGFIVAGLVLMLVGALCVRAGRR